VLPSGGTVFDKLAFSLDGRRLCAVGGVLTSRSFNEVTRFWDTTTGRQLGNAPSDAALTYALAYTVDGRTVLVDSVRGVSYLKDGARVGQRLPLDGIFKAAFSADGRELVTIGGTPVEVRFWSLAERRQIGTTVTSRSQVTDAVFSPDGRTVATSTATGAIRLFRTP
jgi:WD40 repeat protein